MNFRSAIALGVLVSLLVAPALLHSQTQGELSQQACQDMRKADEELERAYARALEIARSDGYDAAAKLKAAQAAWVRFRDAELDAHYPSSEPSSYGSVHSMCLCVTRASLTRQRLEQLAAYVEPPEGEVCAPLVHGP